MAVRPGAGRHLSGQYHQLSIPRSGANPDLELRRRDRGVASPGRFGLTTFTGFLSKVSPQWQGRSDVDRMAAGAAKWARAGWLHWLRLPNSIAFSNTARSCAGLPFVSAEPRGTSPDPAFRRGLPRSIDATRFTPTRPISPAPTPIRWRWSPMSSCPGTAARGASTVSSTCSGSPSGRARNRLLGSATSPSHRSSRVRSRRTGEKLLHGERQQVNDGSLADPTFRDRVLSWKWTSSRTFSYR